MDWRARLRPSHYLVASPPARIDGGDVVRVVLVTRTGTRLHVGLALWETIQAGRVDELPDELIIALIDARVLVDSTADELAEVLAENTSAIAVNKVLEQVIQPTAACQLGCGYCGQEHRAAVMDEPTQDLLVAAVASRLNTAQALGSSYERLNIGWFGAEPLLGLAAIRRLTPLLHDVADANGASITSHVVTNGLALTPSIARELVLDHHVTRVEVTLDGPPSIHDARRSTKSGHATFEQIWANLLAVADDGAINFELTLRCNVDATNADAVPDLIDLIAGSQLAQRSRLYFSPVYAWGNDADQVALDPVDYGEREVAWMSRQLAAGLPVQLVPGRREIVCVAVQPDARVIDAFGSEFTCTEVPYVPAYGTPNRYETGNVHFIEREPASAAVNLPFQAFNDEIAAGVVGCARCPLLPVCGGACPKTWHDGKVPCPSHKTNLPERLLLEVAQGRLIGAASD
jgi:Arylsulfatase regulator (Fe-S oxidoreductase)